IAAGADHANLTTYASPTKAVAACHSGSSSSSSPGGSSIGSPASVGAAAATAARTERSDGSGGGVTSYTPVDADLPGPRRGPAQAAHPVPRRRDAADRRGDGPRGLLGQRVDPLP